MCEYPVGSPDDLVNATILQWFLDFQGGKGSDVWPTSVINGVNVRMPLGLGNNPWPNNDMYLTFDQNNLPIMDRYNGQVAQWLQWLNTQGACSDPGMCQADLCPPQPFVPPGYWLTQPRQDKQADQIYWQSVRTPDMTGSVFYTEIGWVDMFCPLSTEWRRWYTLVFAEVEGGDALTGSSSSSGASSMNKKDDTTEAAPKPEY